LCIIHPMNLTVIIPVYNEAKTIAEIVRRVKAVDVATEILIVDDGSTDGTREILQTFAGDPLIRVVLHDRNQGKGAAVRTGIQQAKGEFCIVQDADLEYDPRDYPALMQPIEEGNADVVFGSRFLGAARRPILFWNMIANKILTFITNILYNNILTDMETGYKLFRRDIALGMTLHARGFEFEPEFTAKLLKRHVRIFEVPIRFNPREYSEGKKIKIKDAFVAVWSLFKYRFMD